jgi:hypothetical protein
LTVEVFSRRSGLLEYSAEEIGLLKYLAEERFQESVPNYAFRMLHYDKILMVLLALLSERNLDE